MNDVQIVCLIGIFLCVLIIVLCCLDDGYVVDYGCSEIDSTKNYKFNICNKNNKLKIPRNKS